MWSCPALQGAQHAGLGDAHAVGSWAEHPRGCRDTDVPRKAAQWSSGPEPWVWEIPTLHPLSMYTGSLRLSVLLHMRTLTETCSRPLWI